jgi:hypothetical protein
MSVQVTCPWLWCRMIMIATQDVPTAASRIKITRSIPSSSMAARASSSSHVSWTRNVIRNR